MNMIYPRDKKLGLEEKHGDSYHDFARYTSTSEPSKNLHKTKEIINS